MAVTQPHLTCTSASAVNIVPAAGGATYTVSNGAGWCVQGLPYAGDWSVTFNGSGSATTFNCTPAGGTVSGLVLTMNMQFHNNKSGLDTSVTETWSQLAPAATYNVTVVSISPGASLGLVETHVFNVCPPGGAPSTYLEWAENNAR